MAKKPAKAPISGSQQTTLVDRLNLWIYARRYIKLIGRRWILLFLGAVVGLGASSYRAYQKPNEFESQAILGVDYKVETSAKDTAAEIREANFYDSQVAAMNSATVRSAAREKVLEKDPELLQHRATHAAASHPQNTATFNMVVRSHSRDYARLYAEAWANEFLNYRRNRMEEAFSAEAQKVAEQLKEVKKELETAKDRLEEFRQEHRIASARDALDFKKQEYERRVIERNQLQTQLDLLKETNAEQIARSGFSGGGPGGASEEPDRNAAQNPVYNPVYGELNNGEKFREYRRELLLIQNELDRPVVKNLKPAHPHLEQLRARMASIQEKMEIELGFIRESREAALQNLKTKLAALSEVIKDKREELFAAQQIENQYNERVKAVQKLEARQETLNAMISEIFRGDSEAEVTILEAGERLRQVWGDQDRRKMILMGLLTGLGVGLALAYFLHQLDDRLELAADIEEALEEPVLGQVPHVDKSDIPDGYLFLPRLSQHNMFAESIRGVRSAVMLGVEGGPKQLMLVSSAVPGDGKTTFTVNFAATLAIAGHRVLLVDADLRRGNTHFYFGHDRDLGLSDVLEGEMHWTDVLKDTEIKSLQLINSGHLPPNPGELLVSPITQQFFAEIKQDYDYIVVDCPPLTAIDDTFSLASSADGLLFVVRAGQTSMRFAKTALESVRQRGARIMGVVLNGVTADNPYYYYNNYYHAYYSKREKTEEKPYGLGGKQATKMARPKSRKSGSSIDQQAGRWSGEPSTSEFGQPVSSKLEEFRARRSAKQKRPEPESSADAENPETKAASSSHPNPDDPKST